VFSGRETLIEDKTTDPLFMKEGSSYYFYHNDHLGTPQKITAVNGAVVWSAKYSSFGKATVAVETVENNLRFGGQYFDQETGLHYNYFRHYDPRTGRYLRTDPIGFEGGINIYDYVLNNPINANDPLGLFTYYESAPGKTGKLKCEALKAANCMETCMGETFIVSGGSEKTGHSKGSKHYTDQAFDMSHKGHDKKKTFCCARKCGIKYIKDESKSANHWHFQTAPGQNNSSGALPSESDCK